MHALIVWCECLSTVSKQKKERPQLLHDPERNCTLCEAQAWRKVDVCPGPHSGPHPTAVPPQPGVSFAPLQLAGVWFSHRECCSLCHISSVSLALPFFAIAFLKINISPQINRKNVPEYQWKNGQKT